MEKTSRIFLAIESAIGGGSISLQIDGVEIGNWIGQTGQAKAETLLVDIDEVLRSKGVSVKQLDLVAVSAGPGSFTGIRIGIATAMGLTTGLRIKMASESAIRALAYQFPGHARTVIAVPTGRDAICFQTFDCSNNIAVELEPPATESSVRFDERVLADHNSIFVLHPDIFERVAERENVVDCGRNIAFAVGRACDLIPPPQVEPLFISKSF